MAIVELQIGMIITAHYCDDKKKQAEFSELFVDERMMLGRKIEILKTIITNNYQNIQDAKDLPIKLSALNDRRIILAHGVAAIDGKDEWFTLIRSRKGKLNDREIKTKDVPKWSKDAQEVQNILTNILHEITFRHAKRVS
jgi:hypothetical protein